MSEDRPPLPPGVDLLWGRRKRGQRGPRPGLSIDAIAETAIGIGDREGLPAVSMARVAEELGFTTMSLYRYVANKDELLQLMWNSCAVGAEDVVLEGNGWRERLRMWTSVQRDLLDQHPWTTQMPMSLPPLAPNSLTFVEHGLEALEGTDLTDADKLRVIGLLSSYTLSEARMAHDGARAAAETRKAVAPADRPAHPPTYEDYLRELVDAENFPLLHRIAWNPEPEQPDHARSGGSRSDGAGSTVVPAESGGHEEFLLAIDCILDGVQALIDRRTATA